VKAEALFLMPIVCVRVYEKNNGSKIGNLGGSTKRFFQCNP